MADGKYYIAASSSEWEYVIKNPAVIYINKDNISAEISLHDGIDKAALYTEDDTYKTVSYTHLDVYKRQGQDAGERDLHRHGKHREDQCFQPVSGRTVQLQDRDGKRSRQAGGHLPVS